MSWKPFECNRVIRRHISWEMRHLNIKKVMCASAWGGLGGKCGSFVLNLGHQTLRLLLLGYLSADPGLWNTGGEHGPSLFIIAPGVIVDVVVDEKMGIETTFERGHRDDGRMKSVKLFSSMKL